MAKYRKFIAAIIGVAALVAMRHFEVAVPGMDAIVMDLIIGALTAWGVYASPNEAL